MRLTSHSIELSENSLTTVVVKDDEVESGSGGSRAVTDEMIEICLWLINYITRHVT